MKFHRQYCPECKTETLFLEKLVNPQDGYCKEMEDICQKCGLKFEPKIDNRIKLKI